MNESPNQHDFEELEILLLDSGDSDFPKASRERLNALLRENAKARAFASELLFDDALLADSLSTEAAEAVFKEKEANIATTKQRKNGTWIRIAAAVTIGLIALAFVMNLSSSPTPTSVVATVQSTNRVSGLDHGQTFQPGERIELQQGRAV